MAAASTVRSLALALAAVLAAEAEAAPLAAAGAGGRRLQDVVFTRLEGGACRTAAGGRGTFERVSRGRGECEEDCRSQEDCVAFEFRDEDQCELHTEAITQTSGTGDNECFVKSVVSPSTSTTPASVVITTLTTRPSVASSSTLTTPAAAGANSTTSNASAANGSLVGLAGAGPEAGGLFTAESGFDFLLFVVGVAAAGYCLCAMLCFAFLRLRPTPASSLKHPQV